MELTEGQQNKKNNFTYIVRQSVFFPLISLITIELVIITLEFTTKFIVDFVNTNFSMNLPSYTLMMWTTIVLQTFNILFIAYIIVSWLFTFYIFRPRELMFRKGILKRKEVKYEFEHLERVSVNQSFIGRIFNYGSLIFYSHDLKNEVTAHDVPNPFKYSEEIMHYKGSLLEELSNIKAPIPIKEFKY